MSPQGRRFLEDAEGCKLSAYQDSTGLWTIGVGHTGLVRGQPIAADTKVSLLECDALLAADLKDAEGAVALARASRPKPANQQQIDALISFVFNAGMQAFSGSGVRSAFIHGDDDRVAAALFLWTRAGVDPTALASRRAREAYMYTRGFYLSNAWRPL